MSHSAFSHATHKCAMLHPLHLVDITTHKCAMLHPLLNALQPPLRDTPREQTKCTTVRYVTSVTKCTLLHTTHNRINDTLWVDIRNRVSSLGMSHGAFVTKCTMLHPLLNALQPMADRVAQNLEIISKKFNLVPGVPGFSWDLSFITWYST